MKIRSLHNEKVCESTLQPADRVAARVMNAARHLAGFTTVGVSVSSLQITGRMYNLTCRVGGFMGDKCCLATS